jgi:ubiquinone/menaquinone biosynthesis C-methylase UbiE
MKLNIGSGPDAVPGYVNLDYSPNVLLSRYPLIKRILRMLGIMNQEQMKTWDPSVKYSDARKLQFSENSIDYIFSSHFLEHIYYWEAQKVLRNCHKSLKPNGLIRLALPDYKLIASNFVENYDDNPVGASWEFNRSLLSHPLRESEKLSFFLNSRFGHIHKWHPTPALVKELLELVGFERVEFHSFRKGNFPELEKIEDRSEGTFYVEATKLV